MKKIIIGILSIFLLYHASAGFDVKKNEARLHHTTGKERIEILVELSKYFRRREPKKTLNYGTEALELLRQFPDPAQQVSLLNLLGMLHTDLNNYEDARKYLRQARELAEKTGDEKGDANALTGISVIYFDQGDYDRSLDYLSRALTIYEKLGNREGIAGISQTIGRTYLKIGDHSKALEYFLKAAEIFEKLGNKRKIASINLNIGAVYAVRGNTENALTYYKKTLDICKEIEDNRTLAYVLHNISVRHREKKKFPEALDYAKQALTVREKLGERLNCATTMALIGLIHRDQNDDSTALRYLKKALGISKELNEPEYIAGISVYIASIKRKTGRYAEALSLLKQAETIAEKINVLENRREAAKELAETYTAMKNHEKALEYYKKYKNLNDTLFNENNSKKIAELQTRYESEKKELELMKKNKQIRQLELARQKYIIKSLIIISFLVVLSTLMIYARYRLKVRAHRRLEKEIREHKKTARELLQSQKMESFGILAGGIAHDFNNLLGVIMGFLTMIKENIRDDEATLEMVETAEEASGQAALLSDKFRILSRGKWLTLQELSIEGILERTAEYHPEVGHLLGNVSMSPGLKPIEGDERQLREVVFNLLKNTEEAMSDPGQVTVNVENMTVEKENDFSLEKGDYVKMTVSDNGRGIPPEQLDKIFDPYFSTKDTPYQKGMGLGLAICYATIKQHDGHITIKSQVGKGTTVELYLPAFTTAPPTL